MSSVLQLPARAIGLAGDTMFGKPDQPPPPPPPPPPPAPPPTPNNPYAKKAGVDAAASATAASARGMGGTILTSPQGLSSPANTGTKTLTGQ